MIVYLDSSVLARAYLADEPGHEEIGAMLDDPELALITGTWTRIEVSGALVRAARTGRGNQEDLLTLLDADLAADGPVTVVSAGQALIEAEALALVRGHALRAMDAWHLAVAKAVMPDLTEPGEQAGFATRDDSQAAVAASLGMLVI